MYAGKSTPTFSPFVRLPCLLQVIKALIQNEKVRGWYFKTVFILHFLHWARLFLPHSCLWEIANVFISKKVSDCSSLSSTWHLKANCFHFGAPKQWLSTAPQAYPQVSWSRKTRTSTLESNATGHRVLHLAWLQYHSCPYSDLPLGGWRRGSRGVGAEEENSHDLDKLQEYSELSTFQFN